MPCMIQGWEIWCRGRLKNTSQSSRSSRPIGLDHDRSGLRPWTGIRQRLVFGSRVQREILRIFCCDSTSFAEFLGDFRVASGRSGGVQTTRGFEKACVDEIRPCCHTLSPRFVIVRIKSVVNATRRITRHVARYRRIPPRDVRSQFKSGGYVLITLSRVRLRLLHLQFDLQGPNRQRFPQPLLVTASRKNLSERLSH